MVALADNDHLARKHAPVSPSLLRSDSYVGQETHTPDCSGISGIRYYTPGMGRWPSRDPIRERGGRNIYAFVGNRPVSDWDILGREAGIGIPLEDWLPPEYQAPPSPCALETGFNPDPSANRAIKDFEDWLDQNYNKSIAQGKASIIADVDAEVSGLCFNKASSIPDEAAQFAVGPKTQKKHGEYPGRIMYMLKIGSFSLYSRNVTVQWTSSDCSYSWSGEVYAEDVAGSTKGQSICNNVAHATGLFYERKIEMGSWTISGSGKCGS